MKIMFTAVGGSDPIKRMMDGPMLHCLRVYRPDVVYLYFTQKMLEYENADNRYTWAIHMLGKQMNHSFEIKKIERANLDKVQLFDNFYEDFDNIFDEIERAYPEAELYVNASSGTPAIKSAIVISSAMSKRRITVIQVSSGENRPIHDRDRDDDYDKEIQWECNEDNKPDFIDRTSTVKSDRFLVKVKKENIRKYVDAYDYSAALSVAEEIREYLSADAVRLIAAAVARLKLDYNGVTAALSDTGYEIIPVKDTEKRNFTEYMLWLGIVLERGDYLGFIRGITPAAMVLMEAAVERRTIVGDIKQYCKKKKEHYILTADIMQRSKTGQKILEILDNKFRKAGGFRDSEYTTAQLEALIQEMCEDKKICSYAETIRKAEFTLRNQAAHTIIAVGDELIKRRIGMSASELNSVMRTMSVRLGLVDKEHWTSYQKMNALIMENL